MHYNPELDKLILAALWKNTDGGWETVEAISNELNQPKEVVSHHMLLLTREGLLDMNAAKEEAKFQITSEGLRTLRRAITRV